MDKDFLIYKLSGFIKFVVCVAIVLAIAYFTGFLEGFTPNDFQKAFNKFTGGSSTSHKTTNATTYRPSVISDSVRRGSTSVQGWNQMINSPTKSVIYIYDDSNKNFHYSLQNYIAKSKLKTSYNIYAFTKDYFRSYNVGLGGPTKVCNSFEECKQQRQDAADYASVADFIEKCSKTMCVINGTKQQYISIRKQEYSEAVKVLNALRNW